MVAVQEADLAMLQQIAESAGLALPQPFLRQFLSRPSNVRLVRRASAGQERARRRVLSRLATARVEARFWRYIRKTVYFETLHLLRQIEATSAVELTILNVPGSAADEAVAIEQLPDPAAATVPDEEAASLADVVNDRNVWRAVQALTERQRQVLQLIFVADCTEAQAATTLGISQQAVNKAKLSGLRVLRRLLIDK